ncbi:T9SS type A sorting domain-containing protein [bacterium]|nr:T9SS type A sorting domain-containing protein [bacterium]
MNATLFRLPSLFALLLLTAGLLTASVANGNAIRFVIPISFDYNSLTSADFGDLDHDGDIDIVVAHNNYSFPYTPDRIIWKENLGNMQFEGHELFVNADAYPACVRVVDLNGDGWDDVLAAFRDFGAVKAFFNMRNGEFHEQFLASDIEGANLLDAGDIDGDGDLDILAASTVTTSLHLLLNQGAASLLDTVIYEGDDPLRSLEMVDLNGDGVQEAVFVEGSNLRVLYEQDGVQLTTITGDCELSDVAIADTNGDDLQDIFVPRQNGEVTLLTQQPGGDPFTFNSQYLGLVFEEIYALAAADLDSDGSIDLVNGTPTRVFWAKNLGDFNYNPRLVYSYGSLDVKIRDLNDDGLLDLFTGYKRVFEQRRNDNFDDVAVACDVFNRFAAGDLDNDGNQDYVVYTSDQVGQLHWISVQENETDWHFIANPTVGIQDIYVADIDDDDDLDVMTVRNHHPMTIYRNLYSQNGTVSFNTLQFNEDVGSCYYVRVLDLNQDGMSDLLLSNDAIAWYENQDQGESYVYHELNLPGTDLFNLVCPTDWDQDDDPDLIISSAGNGFQLLFFECTGILEWQVVNSYEGDLFSQVEITDFDHDGDDDFTFMEDGGFYLWRNDGTGSYTPEYLFSSNLVRLVQISDLNMDGLSDFVSSDLGRTYCWLNQGGTFIRDIALSIGRSELNGLDVRDMNGDQVPDITVSGNNMLMTAYNQFSQTLPIATVTLTSPSPGMIVPGQGGEYPFNLYTMSNVSVPLEFSFRRIVTGPDNYSMDEDWFTQTFDPLEGLFLTSEPLTLPASAPPGEYTMTVQVREDEDTIYGEDSLTFEKAVDLAVKEAGGLTLPQSFALHPAVPNPFNPSCVLMLDLPHGSRVEVDLFNILGQRVGRLMNGEQRAGSQRVLVDGSRMASGLYFVRASTDHGDVAVRKVMLVR